MGILIVWGEVFFFFSLFFSGRKEGIEGAGLLLLWIFGVMM